MKKTFEISAYGVEEMNQQELLMVEGGSAYSAFVKWLVKVIRDGTAFELLVRLGNAFLSILSHDGQISDELKAAMEEGDYCSTIQYSNSGSRHPYM